MTYRENDIQHRRYQCLYTVGHQLTDLYLTYCGIEHCIPEHSYGPVARNEYVIHFVLGGHGYYQIDGKSYELFPNQAFLIPPDITTYYHADPANPYEYAWVGFGGKMASSYVSNTGLSKDCPILDLNIPAADFLPFIRPILEAKELTSTNELKRIGYLYQLLSALISSSQASASGKVPLNYSPETYVEYALQYIEHHYNQITVSDIVDYVGITRSYLHTIFRKKLQMSPQEYLISYRLGVAKTLLTDTEDNLGKIASQLGYSDSLTFSKAFKKHFGISPAAFRKTSFQMKGEADIDNNTYPI